jgi:hypothetical protein
MKNYELSHLVELERIKALKAQYCRFIDLKRFDARADLFVDDCQFLLDTAEKAHLAAT